MVSLMLSPNRLGESHLVLRGGGRPKIFHHHFYFMKQYTKLVISDSICSIGTGLFSPFWYLFLIQKAGENNFAYLIGSMLFSTALFSYFSGIISDKIGRKSSLLFSRSFLGVAMVLYVFTGTLFWLYILQILSGTLFAIEQTVSMSLLGDLTTNDNRGKYIGLYHSTVGVFVALMVLLGGFVASTNTTIVFIISSITVLFSSLPLFWL